VAAPACSTGGRAFMEPALRLSRLNTCLKQVDALMALYLNGSVTLNPPRAAAGRVRDPAGARWRERHRSPRM